ncbi:MAG: twin-arginine translocase TatA/TatE family subunit [Methylovirgula sp.]
MFEFDAGKFVIIGIVALIVIGPKELPRVMRQVGQAVAKLRRLSAEFQAQFMEAMREADLDEIKAEAAKISEAAKLDTGMDMNLDPLAGIRAELTKNIEERSDNSTPEAAAALPSRAEPVAVPLLAKPLAEASHDDPASALDGVEFRDATAEPLAAVPAVSASSPEGQAPEPVPVSAPLHKRA